MRPDVAGRPQGRPGPGMAMMGMNPEIDYRLTCAGVIACLGAGSLSCCAYTHSMVRRASWCLGWCGAGRGGRWSGSHSFPFPHAMRFAWCNMEEHA